MKKGNIKLIINPRANRILFDGKRATGVSDLRKQGGVETIVGYVIPQRVIDRPPFAELAPDQ